MQFYETLWLLFGLLPGLAIGLVLGQWRLERYIKKKAEKETDPEVKAQFEKYKKILDEKKNQKKHKS